MSIQKLFSDAVEKLRYQAGVLAVLDNPNAPLKERARAIEIVLRGNLDLWLEIARRTAPKPVLAPVVAVLAPTKEVVTPALLAKPAGIKPGTILSSSPASTPMPGKPLPSDRRERVMKGEPPKPPANGDFAAKINGATVQLELEDKSLLGRFRKVLADWVSKGIEYWNLCREVTEDALRGADLTDPDWDLLVEKMKHNLFFTGGKAELFINRCPKEKLAHLLLDQDGLTGLVAQIRAEEYENKSSAYRIAFILDASIKVGHEAETLRINCMHAVNHMEQLGFIPSNHWLVRKVADMKRSQLPAKLFASPESVSILAEVQAEAPVLVRPESPEPPVEVAVVVESTDPDTMTMEELEARTAPELPAQMANSNGDGKPEKLDPAYAAQFAAAMGESITVN